MEISVGAGRHICARGEPELSARNYRTWLPDIDKWSSVVYEILHDLHSYTLTSGAPDLPGIVRTTFIGRKQFGHFGRWSFMLRTQYICLSPSGVTSVALKGSVVLIGGRIRD